MNSELEYNSKREEEDMHRYGSDSWAPSRSRGIPELRVREMEKKRWLGEKLGAGGGASQNLKAKFDGNRER